MRILKYTLIISLQLIIIGTCVGSSHALANGRSGRKACGFILDRIAVDETHRILDLAREVGAGEIFDIPRYNQDSSFRSQWTILTLDRKLFFKIIFFTHLPTNTRRIIDIKEATTGELQAYYNNIEQRHGSEIKDLILKSHQK